MSFQIAAGISAHIAKLQKCRKASSSSILVIQGLQPERIICYHSIEERWHAEVYFAQVNTGLNPVSPVLPDSDLLPGV
jgi:hypothetical protein